MSRDVIVVNIATEDAIPAALRRLVAFHEQQGAVAVDAVAARSELS